MSKLEIVETNQLDNNVYLFHNTKHNMIFYTNAENYADAMMKFDLCGFENRTEWKIFVECGDQPA